MGTVPNPWMKREESDERAAETVVFGRGKSDSTGEVASSWYHSCILYGRDRVAPLVADPSRANSTAWQNPPICKPQHNIARLFVKNMHFFFILLDLGCLTKIEYCQFFSNQAINVYQVAVFNDF